MDGREGVDRDGGWPEEEATEVAVGTTAATFRSGMGDRGEQFLDDVVDVDVVGLGAIIEEYPVA